MKRDKSNPVAKYMRKYNKATVQTDRKKAMKKGDRKHKGRYEELSDAAKVECPKCDGAGCKHCDQKGWHVSEEVETNSAAKKAIYVTNPNTGKREVKMEPTHRKKLDKMHKDHDAMHEGLALPGYPEQEKMKVVDPFKKVTVKEEGLLEFLRVKTNPAFVSRKSTRDTNTGNNKQKNSSQSITTTSGNGYKVSRNIKTGQTTKSRTNVGGKNMKEGVDITEAMSVKLRNKMKELAGGELPRNSVELRKLKVKAQAELKTARADKRNAPKKVSYTSKGNVHMGNKGSDERNIIMQLRKAQDLGGKHDIRVSPKQGRTTRLDKKMIDQLLKNYDGLSKPKQKRAFVVQLTRALRKRAK